MIPFSITPRPALGPIQPPIQSVLRSLSSWVKLTTHLHPIVELYLHSPICLQGVVLNWLSTGTTLLFRITGILDFVHSPVLKTRRFGSRICFRPQVRGPHILLGPLEKANFTLRPPFTSRKVPSARFCYRLSQPQGHSAAGRNGSRILYEQNVGKITGFRLKPGHTGYEAPNPDMLIYYERTSVFPAWPRKVSEQL
jgi:hypothetical protein